MLRPALLVAMACAPSAALTQSWTPSGDIVVGITDASEGTAIARINADVTFSLEALTDLPAKIDVGTFMYVLPSKRPHETYISLVWQDRWRIGAVRPAYDAVLPSVFAFHAPYLAYDEAENTRAFATVQAMRKTAVPYGLSYTADEGSHFWGVSLHVAPEDDFQTLSGAVSVRHAAWTFSAAAEGVWHARNKSEEFNTKLGVEYQQGNVDLKAAFFHPEANDRSDLIALEASYQLTGDASVSAFGEVVHQEESASYGMALNYALSPRTSLGGAITQQEQGMNLHFSLAVDF